jgi:hypothetical protein
MQSFNLRHQFNLHWRKIVLLSLSLLFFSVSLFGQARFNPISTAGQDDKFLSYGFFLAGHTNYWRLTYSEEFLNRDNANLNNIQSIVPVYTPGFSLGFLATFRFHDQLNLLFTPKIGFYEFRTDINYFTTGSVNPALSNPATNNIQTRTVINEATMVEFPLFFKYKAQRFNNSRMFFTGGGSFMFRTKDQEEADAEDLVTTGRDITLDLGMGFDMYFKYFKFSPEIRFSHGLANTYRNEATDPLFRDAISGLRRKSITLYLNFQ